MRERKEGGEREGGGERRGGRSGARSRAGVGFGWLLGRRQAGAGAGKRPRRVAAATQPATLPTAAGRQQQDRHTYNHILVLLLARSMDTVGADPCEPEVPAPALGASN